MGRINHEHVIPFSELSLKELIGSGAEGKVCVAAGWLFGCRLGLVGCCWACCVCGRLAFFGGEGVELGAVSVCCAAGRQAGRPCKQRWSS